MVKSTLMVQNNVGIEVTETRQHINQMNLLHRASPPQQEET